MDEWKFEIYHICNQDPLCGTRREEVFGCGYLGSAARQMYLYEKNFIQTKSNNYVGFLNGKRIGADELYVMADKNNGFKSNYMKYKLMEMYKPCVSPQR